MSLDWLRVWPEFIRLNLAKRRHVRRIRSLATNGRPPPPAPCQAAPDSGRAHETHCEACLRFDRGTRYRRVCPALRLRPQGAFCSLDSADIRPDWTRAVLAFSLPPLLLFALAVLATWLALRLGAGLERLPLLDVAWPPRWDHIAEHRRARFRDLALHSLRQGDAPAAAVSLFSAARSGEGNPDENIALARLATLGGFHSLADDLHTRNAAAHPARAAELAIAWHDDLLLARRPRELARLALDQLARPGTPREFWLRAFFASIRHPGVSAALLAPPAPPALPHDGLRHALLARQALDRGDKLAASDQLLALAGSLPGQAARRFLALSWSDADDTPRAKAAAAATNHPAPPGEIATLAYALLHREGRPDDARPLLRPLLGPASLRIPALAALIAHPDAPLLRELDAGLPPEARSDPRLLGALWLAALRADATDLADATAASLERCGAPVPAELLARQTPREAALRLAAALLPLDREILQAMGEPPAG